MHAEIQSGRFDVARKIYAKALTKSESQYARTFLLCALLEQRCGNIERGMIPLWPRHEYSGYTPDRHHLIDCQIPTSQKLLDIIRLSI
jgi:hypothetical protein